MSNQEPTIEFISEYDDHGVASSAIDIAEITLGLRKSLPALANRLITANHDMSEPENITFAANPDDYLEHAPDWHQYGILTHSYEFARAMKDDVPKFVRAWGLARPVYMALSECVDGVEKHELLGLVSLLHDVGKFAVRKPEEHAETDKISYDFKDHETSSGSIIRNDIYQDLASLGLSDKQIEYIASCAELHFELGKIRRVMKAKDGYTMRFIDTPEFSAALSKVIYENPDYALEIGLQFMADSLSKSEIYSLGTTDDEIENQRLDVAFGIAKRGLNPQIINQALQVPVNLKVARLYLTKWASAQARHYIPVATDDV